MSDLKKDEVALLRADLRQHTNFAALTPEELADKLADVANYSQALRDIVEARKKLEVAEGLIKEVMEFFEPAGFDVALILDDDDAMKTLIDDVERKQADWLKRSREFLGMETST
jgi:L-lactate utilization protein LutB